MTEPDGPGFAITPGVLSAAEVDLLCGHLSGSKIRRTRGGARNLLAEPAASAVAHDPRLLALASRALGAQAFPFKATLFDKSLRANWLVAWHQDTVLPIKARREVAGWGPWSLKAGVLYAKAPAQALSLVVALRLHLDDSSSANGPLRVLPGTHRLGVLPPVRIQELSSAIRSVECLVARGGIITMWPLFLHASSRASGSAPRRVLHVEYAASTDLGNTLELDVAEQRDEADEAR
jgi:ectoine hydroxylase-related dioxygenase (phytanoyl-CoA dioxygenase family)